MLSVKYIDASIHQVAKMSNIMLKKSPAYATELYNKGCITSRHPYVTEKTIRKFFNTGDFYNNDGFLTKEGRKSVAEMFKKTFGKANITLKEYLNKMVKAYKQN